MSDISKIRVGETVYDIKDQAGRDAFTNSKVNFINDGSDDDHIPTAKTVFDYGQTIKTNILEKKISTIDSSSDNEHFPSAKAVYDYCQTIGSSGGSGGGSGEGGASSAEFLELATKVSERFEFFEQDYYAIQTFHCNPDTDSKIEDESNFLNGTYKLANFIPDHDVCAVTPWGTFLTQPVITLNFGAILALGKNLYFGGPGGLVGSSNGLFDGSHTIIVLAPQDFVIPENNGEEVVELTVEAGVYVTTNKPLTLSFLVKKDHYIPKKVYPYTPLGESFLDSYFKITEEFDLNGIYSISGPKQQVIGEGESMITKVSYSYNCGGPLVPIEELMPEFEGFSGIYAVPTNPTLAAMLAENNEPPLPAMVVFTESLTFPEEMFGTEFTVTPGLYVFYSEMPFMEVVILQEKEKIVDLDALINKEIFPNNILDTLIGLFMQNPTEVATLELDNSHILNEALMKDFYQTLFAVFYQKGNLKFKTHSTELGNAMDFLNIPNIWSVLDGTIMCAGLTNTVNLNGTWVDVTIQLTSREGYFSLLCSARAK